MKVVCIPHVALGAFILLLTGCRTAVIDRSYLDRDPPAAGARGTAGCDRLSVPVASGAIGGQILRPAAFHGEGRPVAILCRAYDSSAPLDDLAVSLCRAGCVVVVPDMRDCLGESGRYAPAGSIRDVVALVDNVRGKDFRARHGADGRSVFLVGHSLSCPTVVKAAEARRSAVRGLVLLAPYDLAYSVGGMTADAAKAFLTDCGLGAPGSDGIGATYREIMNGTSNLVLATSAVPLKGMNVFLAAGSYDGFAPTKPVDEFWALPVFADAVRVRREYAADHSLMDVRCALASDVADFMLDVIGDDMGLQFMTDDEIICELYRRLREGEAGDELSLAAILDDAGTEYSRAVNSVSDSTSSHAHAAMNAIQAAERKFGKHDLSAERLTLYVTSEPCAMCAGGIAQAGIRRVVYGVSAAKYTKATGKPVDLNPDWRKALASRGIEVIGPLEEQKGEEAHVFRCREMRKRK